VAGDKVISILAADVVRQFLMAGLLDEPVVSPVTVMDPARQG
jgi:hypothetical protein